VEIKAMRTFATEQNPEFLHAQEELLGLQAQLAKLEKSQPTKEGDFMVPTGSLPEAAVEYVRKLRDVKYYETLFEMLAKQYELAKMQESNNASVIQILDKAIPAERKTRPKRALIVLMGTLLGVVLGVLSVFIYESYRRLKESPENSRRWNDLVQALRGSRLST
jgi:uncharacterized protein involved in exopolysaccharide biosynthesis